MMKGIIDFLVFIYDFFIPRFIVEDVAIVYGDSDSDFDILCCVDDLTDDDYYDCVATSKALVWMFWGFFATIYNFRSA